LGSASPGPPEEVGVARLGEAVVVPVAAAGGSGSAVVGGAVAEGAGGVGAGEGDGPCAPLSWAFAAEASVTTKATVQKEAAFMWASCLTEAARCGGKIVVSPGFDRARSTGVLT
jgi:hypothetical protein